MKKFNKRVSRQRETFGELCEGGKLLKCPEASGLEDDAA